MALLWTESKSSTSFLYQVPDTWMQHPREDRGAESPSPPCWSHCFGWSPGHGCHSGLWVHISSPCLSLLSTNTPKSSSSGCFQSVLSWPYSLLGISPIQVQHLALGSIVVHEICMGLPLKCIKVPLDDISALQCVNCATELGADNRLAEGLLHPTLHVTKDVKKYWL